MSFSIPSVSSSTAANAVIASRPPTPTRTSRAADSSDAVQVDTMPGSPPPEVSAAIAGAAATWQKLADAGQSVRFGADPSTGRVTAQLTDASGVTVTLTGAQTLALAGGELPEPNRV